MKVSVVIPIYKVEPFIERCATTLMEQTLREVEYIFVDDATPDNSIRILEDVIARYPHRKEQVRIVHHTENKGLPAARNTGLALATGEYIFHCDSDDYVEPTMLEEMYNAAKEQDADIVWCDWYLTFAQNERYMKQPSYETPLEALKAMLSGAMKYNVWNKLVKRSLYVDNNILFPAGYGMGEDMTMICITACAATVAYVPKAFYHYVRSNSEAMTQTYSERHLADVRYNVDKTISFVCAKGVCGSLDVALFKLNVKLPFLITDDWSSYRRWNEWYPEANKYINHQSFLPLRTLILQYLAAKHFYLFVWIYYQVVYRFWYKVVY